MADICDTCVHFPPSTFGGKPCSFCDPLNPEMTAYARREELIQTNADRIRAMSDEELAEFVANMVDHDWCCDSGCMIKHAGMCGYAEKGCDESALHWLQSPAEGGDGDAVP